MKKQLKPYMIVLTLVLLVLGICTLACVWRFARPTSSLPAPTPHSTSDLPLSSESILVRYENEIQSLVEELQSQKDWLCDSDLQSEDDVYVTLIPFNKRLYYPQEILFPSLAFGNPETSRQLYVTYDYARGIDLSTVPEGSHWIKYEVADFSDNLLDTQEIFMEVYVFVRTEERLCALEHHLGSAGPGLSVHYNTRHRDLVEEVLPSLQSLKPYQTAIADTLEGILCYATGIDFYPSLPLSRRLALIEWALQSSYWSDREQAASTLALKGSQATTSVALLVQVVQTDESVKVRDTAIRALGDIGMMSEDVIQVLKDAIWQDYRPLAISAIYSLTGEQALPIFIEVLRDHPDGYVRSAAASQIAGLGIDAREAKPVLVTALEREPNDFARAEIVKALGNLGVSSADVLPLLVQVLNTDSNTNVRSAAARALGNIDREGIVAIPELIRALNDKSGVAGSAAYVLGKYGSKAELAVPALIQVIEKNPETGLVRIAATALREITGEDLGTDYRVWQEWWETQQ